MKNSNLDNLLLHISDFVTIPNPPAWCTGELKDELSHGFHMIALLVRKLDFTFNVILHNFFEVELRICSQDARTRISSNPPPSQEWIMAQYIITFAVIIAKDGVRDKIE